MQGITVQPSSNTTIQIYTEAMEIVPFIIAMRYHKCIWDRNA